MKHVYVLSKNKEHYAVLLTLLYLRVLYSIFDIVIYRKKKDIGVGSLRL